MIKLKTINIWDVYSLSMQECKEVQVRYPAFAIVLEGHIPHRAGACDAILPTLKQAEEWCEKHRPNI